MVAVHGAMFTWLLPSGSGDLKRGRAVKVFDVPGDAGSVANHACLAVQFERAHTSLSAFWDEWRFLLGMDCHDLNRIGCVHGCVYPCVFELIIKWQHHMVESLGQPTQCMSSLDADQHRGQEHPGRTQEGCG